MPKRYSPAFPHFDADKLLGANIDKFHQNPDHQRALLTKLSSTFKSELLIGGRDMNMVANPVRNDEGTHRHCGRMAG